MIQDKLWEKPEEWPIPVKITTSVHEEYIADDLAKSGVPEWWLNSEAFDKIYFFGRDINIHILLNKDGSYEVTKVTGI